MVYANRRFYREAVCIRETENPSVTVFYTIWTIVTINREVSKQTTTFAVIHFL